MQRVAAEDVSCYQTAWPPRPATSGEVDAAERRGEQPLVPLRRLATAPTPTTTATTRPRSTAASGRTTDDPVDWSWALTVYEPGFTAPAWARQRGHLPDLPRPLPQRRQRKNDPQTGDDRYDEPGDRRSRGTRCPRATAATTRTPRGLLTDREGPRGRDYYRRRPRRACGRSSTTSQSLGVTAIYFNPIFTAQARTTATTRPTTRGSTRRSGDSEGVREARQAGRAARDPRHPRRRLQPHVVGQPALRPLPPLPAASAPASRRARRTAAGSPSGTQNVPCGSADYEGWFGFDSIPRAEEVEPGRAGATS